jgi:hypothetical protein
MELWGASLFGQPCGECGFDWSLDPDEAVTIVADGPAAVQSLVSGRRRASRDWRLVGDGIRESHRRQPAQLV